jgi:hypothetical protein
MNYDAVDTYPKHLRVGVNSALVSLDALTKLLVDKGVFTLDEYEKYLADAMENEVKSYAKALSRILGGKVDLL